MSLSAVIYLSSVTQGLEQCNALGFNSSDAPSQHEAQPQKIRHACRALPRHLHTRRILPILLHGQAAHYIRASNFRWSDRACGRCCGPSTQLRRLRKQQLLSLSALHIRENDHTVT